jgi:hypothetical protein
LKKKILHITPHLGGGVGKAVSTLINNDKEYCHDVICLEKPINYKFYHIIKKKNKIIITKNISIIKNFLKKSDIVQVEFWNHPLLLKILTSLKNFKHRVIFWLHISGEKFPKIPTKILKNKKIDIVFSSKQSFKYHHKLYKKNFHFISSATILLTKSSSNKKFFKCVYIGSFHPNKINNNIISLIASSSDVIKRFDMYGEDELKDKFLGEVRKNKLQKIVYIRGFKKNINNILNKSSVLLYFLKKDHYGTGENILIECMSSGVIPVVLNNPLERSIIKNNVNGIVLKDKKNLRGILLKLKFNKKFRINLSKKCIKFANANFNIETQVKNFNFLYDKKIIERKYNFNFSNILGNNPSKMFFSFLDNKRVEAKKIFFNNKGGILHFKKVFNNDVGLSRIYKRIATH